jgi:hypothetical protein
LPNPGSTPQPERLYLSIRFGHVGPAFEPASRSPDRLVSHQVEAGSTSRLAARIGGPTK